jgi:hypothetical protein
VCEHPALPGRTAGCLDWQYWGGRGIVDVGAIRIMSYTIYSMPYIDALDQKGRYRRAKNEKTTAPLCSIDL